MRILAVNALNKEAMKGKDNSPGGLKNMVVWVERAIIVSLIGIMSILLLLSTIELGYTVFKAIVSDNEDKLIIDLDNLLNVFGVFMLVLIGIELLDTIKVYFKENVIHVEVVMLVALIAIARKVIVLDFELYSGLEIIGMGVVIISVSAGYYLIKKTGGSGFWPKEKEVEKKVVIEEEPIEDDPDLVKKTKIVTSKSKENIVSPEDTPLVGTNPKDIGFNKSKE